jgi:ABC-type polysaccharide/polyol phosphate transport system ATPase subunit
MFVSALFKFLLQNFQSNFEGFNLSAKSEEALMDLSFKMHLNTFFGIVDGLNGSTNFADLGEGDLPFVV